VNRSWLRPRRPSDLDVAASIVFGIILAAVAMGWALKLGAR
jgi:hypothetical protein